MKCPLLLPIIYQLGGLPDGNEDECKKEECAWWNAGLKYCQHANIAIQLSCIHDTLAEIADKMPTVHK